MDKFRRGSQTVWYWFHDRRRDLTHNYSDWTRLASGRGEGCPGELATSKDKPALAASLRELKGEPTRVGHVHGKDTRCPVLVQRPRVFVICFQYFSPVRPSPTEPAPLSHCQPITFRLGENERIVNRLINHGDFCIFQQVRTDNDLRVIIFLITVIILYWNS